MVMVRALLVSPRVSAPPVTPMVGAVWVSHVSGFGVVGGGVVAGGVTVDGVGDVDGRSWCRCWFWVWVYGLLWALLAGLPSGPGGVYRLLVLSVLGGRSWQRVISLVGVLRVLLQGLGVGEV